VVYQLLLYGDKPVVTHKDNGFSCTLGEISFHYPMVERTIQWWNHLIYFTN